MLGIAKNQKVATSAPLAPADCFHAPISEAGQTATMAFVYARRTRVRFPENVRSRVSTAREAHAMCWDAAQSVMHFATLLGKIIGATMAIGAYAGKALAPQHKVSATRAYGSMLEQ
mmetsp:Transcript_46012/g.84362  ORF Transcript_46012/g.84362 Transcript_46012/m.84362 type:complete len:116 (+) Transcript_46012:189-536(+)